MNLLRVHSTSPYGYALSLLDTLFMREEQHWSLLFKSKKSDKPAQDPVKVEKILRKFTVNLNWFAAEALNRGQDCCESSLC